MQHGSVSRRLRAAVESLENRRLFAGPALDTSFSADGNATASTDTEALNTVAAN